VIFLGVTSLARKAAVNLIMGGGKLPWKEGIHAEPSSQMGIHEDDIRTVSVRLIPGREKDLFWMSSATHIRI